MKESVNEAPQEYRVYVKQKAHVGGSASKKFSVEKFQTGGMYFDYKKGMDTIKKLRKMNSTADYKLVKEGVDILNELRIDLPNFDYEKHKRDIFGLFNKLKIKGMLGDRQGKVNWLVLKDKDDWKKAEPILKKLKIKYKLKESTEGEHHQAITKFILTALSKALLAPWSLTKSLNASLIDISLSFMDSFLPNIFFISSLNPPLVHILDASTE